MGEGRERFELRQDKTYLAREIVGGRLLLSGRVCERGKGLGVYVVQKREIVERRACAIGCSRSKTRQPSFFSSIESGREEYVLRTLVQDKTRHKLTTYLPSLLYLAKVWETARER